MPLLSPKKRMEILGLYGVRWERVLEWVQYLMIHCHLRCDLFPFLFKNKLV